MADYMLRAGAALCGEDLHLEKDVAFFISGGKIAAIRRKAECPEDEASGYKKLDLGDVVLMPGLIDCHSHTSLDARAFGHLERMNDPLPDLTIRAVNNMRDDLLSGITTARILGEKGYVDISVRDAIHRGELIGPRLLTAGIGMRSIHGHGFVGVPHTGVQEFVKTSRENMLRRVHQILINL